MSEMARTQRKGQQETSSNLYRNRRPEMAVLQRHPLSGISNQVLQARLTVNQPGDRYEQEADRVAGRVMRMPTPALGPAAIQRACPACEEEVQRQPDEEEEEEMLQARPLAAEISPIAMRQVEEEEEEPIQASRSQATPIAADVEAEIEAMRGGGRPLSSAERAFFEPRFGLNFAQVRLHNSSQAHRTAASIHAAAFTSRNHIFFGHNQYQPHTAKGRHLMAHELTHVVQQNHPSSHSAASPPSIQRLFGIRLPTGLRFLTSEERSTARGVYGSSLNFSRILLSDALGGGGRPFTTYVPVPLLGDATVINAGPSLYGTPGSNTNLLIHELAHCWQSQHHPDPKAFMVNSIASQAAAGAIGGGASAYCYVPGKWFGFYAAEQIAEQVENGEAPIVSHVSSVSAGATDVANIASLSVPRWETRGDPGVRC